MSTHYSQKILRGDVEQVFLEITDRVIHRYGADHCGRFFDKLTAEGVCFAVVAQIHYCFRAEFDCHIHLLHLDGIVLAVARNAEIDVDFGAQPHADTLRRNGGVAHIAGNRDNALRHSLSQQFNVHVLLDGDNFHFGCDNAFFSGFHLCVVFFHFGGSFQSD